MFSQLRNKAQTRSTQYKIKAYWKSNTAKKLNSTISYEIFLLTYIFCPSHPEGLGSTTIYFFFKQQKQQIKKKRQEIARWFKFQAVAQSPLITWQSLLLLPVKHRKF
jgi:hypothetical protein